ncbi:glycosyltransferase [Paenibacillus gansuensis]|uniref:Glycosyltransferase n=1 Tax=Paenibacillus gansuensis TaxID=306542 RepID=A0ABW5PBN4_9BACL
MLPKASRFHADTVVYDCVDDFPDWEQDEIQWVDSADLIVCTAEPLMEKMHKLVPHKPIHLVRNGCDWDFFAGALSMTTEHLASVPAAPGGKIGYIGAWAPWVDEELLRKAAASLPDSQFIIVGPQLREDLPDMGENVHYLGYRDYTELPRILSYLDVCIIPFRLNRITASTNPIKVYEYMAAGKPVISTDLPEVRKLRPYVHVAESDSEFIELIRQNLSVSKKESTRLSEFAKSSDWEQRFDQIHNMLKDHDPQITPAWTTGILDGMTKGHKTRSIPLGHCTVNSYYANLNLEKDPSLIGFMSTAEYQCYFKPLTTHPVLSSSKVFLEFNLASNGPGTDDAWVDVGILYSDWNLRSLTFQNKPVSTNVASVRRCDSLTETITLELTSYFRQGAMPSFHFTSRHPQLLAVHGARLTIIDK